MSVQRLKYTYWYLAKYGETSRKLKQNGCDILTFPFSYIH